MKIKDLSPATLAAIKKTRYDQIVGGKHEGPEKWSGVFVKHDPRSQQFYATWQKEFPESKPASDPEFMQVGGAAVLLPFGSNYHADIVILHYFFSEDRSKLVLYIKDLSYVEDPAFRSGFIAICDKFDGEDFYLATFYHEWFMLGYDPLSNLWKKKEAS
ncbi:MAG: hypothetical protein AAB316_00080 [Bacteroidota bacterium]